MLGYPCMGFRCLTCQVLIESGGAYLRENGFRRYIVDDHGQHVYTVDDFCRDHPTGTYVLGIDGHVVCVKDGHYWDTWDSGQEIPIYYWEK